MLIDPVERLWMCSHWLALSLFSLKWHSLQIYLLTVVNCCAGDSVCAIVLKLYWSELNLYWSEVLVKDLQQFVVKPSCSCVWVIGIKVVRSGPPVITFGLQLYWSELKSYWSELLTKDLQRFVVKWQWSCVWVIGTKLVPSVTLMIVTSYVVILCWYWSGQFVVKRSWILVEVGSLLVEIFTEQPLAFGVTLSESVNRSPGAWG